MGNDNKTIFTTVRKCEKVSLIVLCVWVGLLMVFEALIFGGRKGYWPEVELSDDLILQIILSWGMFFVIFGLVALLLMFLRNDCDKFLYHNVRGTGMRCYRTPWNKHSHNEINNFSREVTVSHGDSVKRHYLREYAYKVYNSATHRDEQFVVYSDVTAGRSYVYVGDGFMKLVLMYEEIVKKCTRTSVKKAFRDAYLLKLMIEEGRYYKISFDNSDKVYYCLKVHSSSIFPSRYAKTAYRNAMKLMKRLSENAQHIHFDKLKGKGWWLPGLEQFLVKFGLKLAIGAVIAGVAGAAAGAGLSIFDGDDGSLFGMDGENASPDLDFDVDGFDASLGDNQMLLTDGSDGQDVDFFESESDGYFDSSSNNGYNVSFGSQKETLTAQGGGQHIDVTIEKEPGTSNKFSISSSNGTIHNVSGGDMWVKINGINYKLPRLKG